MSKIRVGHIGAGGKGRQHMQTVANMEGVELVAVCDPIEPLRTKFADDFGAEGRYDKIESMLANEDLDAAFVTTPAHINAIAALPCLEAGVNTFLEKPPGISLKETTELRDAATRSGAQGMVGWNRRFEPVIRKPLEMIKERGEVAQLVCIFHKNMTRLEKMTDRFPEELLDNFIWETPIHAIDLMRFLAGSEVAEVHGACRRVFHKYKDAYSGLVYFENGCMAHLIFNMTGTPRLERYEIHGRDISAYIEREAYVIKDGERIDIEADDDKGTALEDRFFIECIRDGKKIDLPGANLDEAVKSMEVGHAILQRLLPT